MNCKVDDVFSCDTISIIDVRLLKYVHLVK